MVAHKPKRALHPTVAALAANAKRIDVAKLAAEQGVKPLADIDEFAMRSLEGEKIEDLQAELRSVRRL